MTFKYPSQSIFLDFDVKLTLIGDTGLLGVQNDPCSREESKPPAKATITNEEKHVVSEFVI